MTTSASGSTLDNASGALVDASGVTWTLTGVVAGFLPVLDGTADMRFRGDPVVSLLYSSGSMYARTASRVWLRYANGEFYTHIGDPRGVPSFNGTAISSVVGEIIDGSLIHWTLVPITGGYEPSLNGIVDTRVAANPVQILVFYSGKVYAYASDQVWYAYTDGNYTAVAGDPRPGGTSSSGVTLSAASGSIIDASRVKWTLAAVPGGYEPVRNGVPDISFIDNPVQLLLFQQGTMYVLTANTNWYAWNGTTYIQYPNDPRFLA